MSPGPGSGRPAARAHRRRAPSLLAGAGWGALVGAVSAVVVLGVVVAITQGTVSLEWLWAMVPVSALAGLVLARRLVPRP